MLSVLINRASHIVSVINRTTNFSPLLCSCVSKIKTFSFSPGFFFRSTHEIIFFQLICNFFAFFFFCLVHGLQKFLICFLHQLIFLERESFDGSCRGFINSLIKSTLVLNYANEFTHKYFRELFFYLIFFHERELTIFRVVSALRACEQLKTFLIHINHISLLSIRFLLTNSTIPRLSRSCFQRLLRSLCGECN